MKLSVVIPVYNEEKDIQKAIVDVYKHFPDAEVITVNDASTDNTASILNSLKLNGLRVLTNDKNMGHGYSVIRGLKEATGDTILYIDADRQIDLANFNRIPDENLVIFDVISGWRVERHDKLFRKITSKCLRLTILFRFGYFIKDSNCPFKIYRREVLQQLLKKVPETHIIPIACLEVIARKEGMLCGLIDTPHKPYEGIREGFLQAPDIKFLKFISKAFNEIIRI
jgi:glycosyltransferase involved in cell wall biosynthesis